MSREGGNTMSNFRIRHEAARWGVKLWQVAQELEVSEATLTRWLRTELDAEREGRILSAIDEIRRARENAG